MRLLSDNPDVLARYQRNYQHILVDEFQDTNTAQYKFLQLLAEQHRNLYVVGDPDQSVYRWRGADYRNVRRFEQDYPNAQVMLLEENYRSTQLILDAAMAVIDRHPGRTRKQLVHPAPRAAWSCTPTRPTTSRKRPSTWWTASPSWCAWANMTPGDCAVMYRTNAQSRSVEEAFLHAGLPYKLVGAQRFYGRKEIKDIVAYLRLVHNPADSVGLMRAINTPAARRGHEDVGAVEARPRAGGVPATQVLRDLAANGSRIDVCGASLAARPGRPGRVLAICSKPVAGGKEEIPVAQLFDLVVDNIGYADYVNDGTEEGMERWANVLELRAVAAETPGDWPERLPGAGGAGVGPGHAGRGGPGADPDDAARGQGAGVPGGVYRGAGRGSAAAPALI